MNNIDKNKKYTESKKIQAQEIIDLKVENQVMRKQLLIMRDMIDNILDDLESREELIIKYVKKYYGGLENLKRCVNCRKIGNWNESFCSKCLSKDEVFLEQEAQEKLDDARQEETIQDNLDKTKGGGEKQGQKNQPTEELKINETLEKQEVNQKNDKEEIK